MKDYLTAKQAAERLGVSDARIRQMIRDGIIQGAERFGRDHAVPETEIIRLQRSERRSGRPTKAKE